MLVVLERAPVTAPCESVLAEKPIAEVLAVYLVVELAVAVSVCFAPSRLYGGMSVASLDARVVEWVDVYGLAQAMG